MTKEKHIFNLSAVLLCDEVREEANGKEILLGVYTGNILVPGFPTTNSVCLWILTEPKNSGKTEREFRVITSKGETVLKGKVGIELIGDENSPATIILPNLPLNIEEAGTLKFQWREPKKRWTTLITKNVMQSEKP